MGLNRTLKETLAPIEDHEGNCPLCKQKYTDIEMVLRNGCDLWVHYACAGVDVNVERDVSRWFCAICVVGGKAPQKPGSSANAEVATANA